MPSFHDMHRLGIYCKKPKRKWHVLLADLHAANPEPERTRSRGGRLGVEASALLFRSVVCILPSAHLQVQDTGKRVAGGQVFQQQELWWQRKFVKKSAQSPLFGKVLKQGLCHKTVQIMKAHQLFSINPLPLI